MIKEKINYTDFIKDTNISYILARNDAINENLAIKGRTKIYYSFIGANVTPPSSFPPFPESAATNSGGVQYLFSVFGCSDTLIVIRCDMRLYNNSTMQWSAKSYLKVYAKNNAGDSSWIDRGWSELPDLEYKQTYNNTEKVHGTYNNKTVYSKTVYFGALPNATRKEVEHNISGITSILKVEALAYDPSAGWGLPMPYMASTTDYITMAVSKSVIAITTSTNRSAYNGYITIYYMK